MGLGRMTSNHSLTWTYTKPNNKLVSAYDATPSPKLSPRWPSFKNAEVWGLEGPLPALSTKRGRGVC